MSVIPVIVAVRCRPLIPKEIQEGSRGTVLVKESNVILSDVNKTFTFDYTFSSESTQSQVYDTCGSHLIGNLFKGYNATILAYGQTGSGKTHTMGTGYFGNDDENHGIVQRALEDIFKGIQDSSNKDIRCTVSFLEVYNEEIYDLFSESNIKEVVLREDASGVKITGLKEITASTVENVFQQLVKGSLNRKTGKTNMNEQSSRSHAIFTLTMEQRDHSTNEDCVSKFHFVDLAGSERAKKTKAEGNRFKEGININRGLLALGNVISALCDGLSHIPYRDSKLTRLLQDSLGGNSYTVMLACISPSDSNLEETLNTLRYADRAKKIKNKPVVNKDPKLREISDLRKALLKVQTDFDTHMKECQSKVIQSTDSYEQNDADTSATYVSFCVDDLEVPDKYKNKLRCVKAELKKKDAEIEELDGKSKRTMFQFANMCGKVVSYESTIDKMKQQLALLGEKAQDCQTADETEELQDLKNFITSTLELSKHNTPQCSPLKGLNFGDMTDISELMAQGATICQELQNVELEIQEKEFLRSKTLQSTEEFQKIKQEYETVITSLKDELEKKEKEREELESKKNPIARMSEDRRIKIRDLQGQIEALHKKLREKTKMLQFKEEQEKKVAALDKEIHSLKSARVRLMKQMDTESKRSQHLMTQMKRLEMQKHREKNKMDLAITKQKAANDLLTRKLQDAQQAKKRLQESVNKQKMMVQERAKFLQRGGVAAAEKISQWLSHDINVEVCRQEAREHVESLKEDRALLMKSKEDLDHKLKEMQSREVPDVSRISPIVEEIAKVQRELDSRTEHIKSIHKDVLVGEEYGDQGRWNSIFKLSEAKCALTYLFGLVVSHKIKLNKTESQIDQQNKEEEALRAELFILDKQLKCQEENHLSDINRLKRDHEEKTLWLLQEMSQDGPSDSLKRNQITAEELGKMEYLHLELSQKTKEINDLQAELETYRTIKKEPEIDSLPRRKTFLTKKVSMPKTPVTDTEEEGFLCDLDDPNDPDWKFTPFMQRFQSAPNKRKPPIDLETSDSENEEFLKPRQKGLKRSTSEVTCKCKGSCNRKNCGCRKFDKMCGTNCLCDPLICINREDSKEEDPSQQETTSIATAGILKPKENKEHLSRLSVLGSTTPIPNLNSQKSKYKDGNTSFFKPPPLNLPNRPRK